MRTFAEATRVYKRAWLRLFELLEQDDGSNPERTKRLKRAYDKIEGGLDGLESVWEDRA